MPLAMHDQRCQIHNNLAVLSAPNVPFQALKYCSAQSDIKISLSMSPTLLWSAFKNCTNMAASSRFVIAHATGIPSPWSSITRLQINKKWYYVVSCVASIRIAFCHIASCHSWHSVWIPRIKSSLPISSISSLCSYPCGWNSKTGSYAFCLN